MRATRRSTRSSAAAQEPPQSQPRPTPVVRTPTKKRPSRVVPPSPESSEQEASDHEPDQTLKEEEQDSNVESEQEETVVTPKPRKRKGRAPRAVVDSDDDATESPNIISTPQPTPKSPVRDATPASTAPSSPTTPTESEASPPSSPTPPTPAAPVVEPPLPTLNLAPTAQDLATAARQAAINHAANEIQREKEREGKPRLVIHQMVLEDFKSYRGRGIIGPFHKSFSSIVGPNGSGKSNTIDALLFVFGYRASKMRQGKLSELIHNSGPSTTNEEVSNEESMAPVVEAGEEEYDSGDDTDDGRKKKAKGKKDKGKKKVVENTDGLIGSCTVEVWFREIIDLPGKDAFTVVPNSQLVVARTAYRNNSSRYTINGKTSNFTEVTTLLKARGIDLDHNRFLILQGEVESIAQMKPKGATEHDEGLLEYLEDIIGTSKYKSAISEALIEVERLNDMRGEKMNRVKLVEREKQALEGRKKEADVYLRDQNELVHNQSALFQVNMYHAMQNAEIYTTAVDNATAALKEEVDAQAGTLKEAEGLQETYDTLLADTKDVEKATNEITQHLAVLDRADVQLQEKRKHISLKVKKLNKSITADTHALSEAQTWVRNNGEEIVKVRASLDKMDKSLEKEEQELEKTLDSLKDKTQVFSTQIESLQQDLQPWAEKIGEKQAAIDLGAHERDLLREKTEVVKKALAEVGELMEKLETEEDTKTAELQTLLAEKATVEKQLNATEKQLKSMQAKDGALRSKASATRQKSDEAKSSQAANRSQSNVLSSLTKLKDQGRLPGFHGRLGDLGRIDDKYDTAISTACGSLDNLVTDTITGGQACIEHLRKNDLGRANVMCLDRISSRNMDRIQTPDNVPRLFDLITFKDQRFAPAFYQALSNTLVASDMDQANRIAFGTGEGGKRWRVVTLDGKLIDTSGTMSGGGGRPAKGGMSSKLVEDDFSPTMIARCEEEREEAALELETFLVEFGRVEEEVKGLRKRIPGIELAMSKIEMDLKTCGKRKEEASRRAVELKSQSKPEAGDTKRIAQLEKEILVSTTALEQLQQKSSAIEDQIKVLQEKILEVGGVKLRSQQTKVQDLKAQIDHSSDRLTKSEVGKAKSEKDSIKLEKALQVNSTALLVYEEEEEELSKLNANGAQDSEIVRTKVEEAQELLAEKKEELGKMKVLLDEQLEVTIQFKARELELKQHFKEQTKLYDDSKHAVLHWSEELGRLKLNDIDDDDEDEEEAAPAAAEGDEDVPMKEHVLTLNSEIRQFTPDEISEINVKVVKGKIAVLQERIGNMSLDLAVLKEYARREREFMERAADLDVVTKERDGAKKLSDDLRNQRLKEFMEGFGIISMKLKEMYQMITLGGNAELELVDSLDPFSEGIIFSVMPPKKSWKNISNLSGGEKTLSSLALVFALHVFKPTPLYFMDEIDAALDFRNVSIVANYIKDRTKNAQFIIISLRNNMFELSSRLIGIYKHDNATRSIAIDNADIAAIESAA